MKIRLTFAVVLAGILALPLCAQVEKQEMPGVVNYSRVDATIGCGGAVEPSAMAALKQEGFASVVNLRQASEEGADIDAGQAAAQAAGLKYIHLPFDMADPAPDLVDNFLATVADDSNQPVFIHCGSANRVAALWMIKRVLQDGWPVDEARAEAEAIGLTNAGLAAFATEYIETHG